LLEIDGGQTATQASQSNPFGKRNDIEPPHDGPNRPTEKNSFGQDFDPLEKTLVVVCHAFSLKKVPNLLELAGLNG
jgi:hypothetical protein